MENAPNPKQPGWPRVLVVSLVAVILIFGSLLIIRLASPQVAETGPEARPDALANSTDACVTCHRNSSPGIVQQFGHSSMAAAKVGCRDCHEVKAGATRGPRSTKAPTC